VLVLSVEGSSVHLGTFGFECCTSLVVLVVVASYKMELFVGNNLGGVELKVLPSAVVSSWLLPGIALLAVILVVILVVQLVVCQQGIRRHCSSLAAAEEGLLRMEAEVRTIRSCWTSGT
jgi:Flp pilus assembly protein protease CpaA